MDRFSVVDGLVGRLEDIERGLGRLAAERAEILDELAALAASSADELVSGDVLRRRERQALARRAVIADVAAATRTTEQVVTALMAESETLVRSLPTTLSGLREGRATHRQCQVIVAESLDLDAEPRAELERRLLLLARVGNHATLKRQARRERERIIPEPFAVRHARAKTHRNVRVEHVRDGMSWINAHVPTGLAASIDDRLRMTALARRYAGDQRTEDQVMADALLAALLAPECACVLGAFGEELPVPSAFDTFRRIQPTVSLTVPVLTLLGHRVTPPPPQAPRELALRARTGRPHALHLTDRPPIRLPTRAEGAADVMGACCGRDGSVPRTRRRVTGTWDRRRDYCSSGSTGSMSCAPLLRTFPTAFDTT